MKDLLRIADLRPGQLARLLELADAAKRQPAPWSDLLHGETVVCHFATPSTLTRLSFGAAVARLGGTAQVVGHDELQLGHGETIEDTARVVSRYARAFVIRAVADEDVARVARAATVPVVNARTDGHHPCQALADLQTLRDHFGGLRGLKLAYLGDGNNVASSLVEACALAGVDIVVATPPGFEVPEDVVIAAERLAAGSGALVLTTHDPLKAVHHADAVYTDAWVAMGTPEDQRAARTAALEPYRVDELVMAMAEERAVFLHCLPAHRGDEVSPAVIDGPRSLVFEQAENRLHTAVAVLVALLAEHQEVQP
jgi:ornithine carbamoyltransferase